MPAFKLQAFRAAEQPLLFGIELLKRGEPVSGILSGTAGLVALLVIIFVPPKRYAVPEILAAVIIGAWTLSFGAKMMFEATNSRRG